MLWIGQTMPFWKCAVSVSFSFHIQPFHPDVVPPLNLTAAYRSRWYARFGQDSSIFLPEVIAVLRRGCISHAGRSFDWNNPSMNCPYHRTFLCLVLYIRKVGNHEAFQSFPRFRIWPLKAKKAEHCTHKSVSCSACWLWSCISFLCIRQTEIYFPANDFPTI